MEQTEFEQIKVGDRIRCITALRGGYGKDVEVGDEFEVLDIFNRWAALKCKTQDGRLAIFSKSVWFAFERLAL